MKIAILSGKGGTGKTTLSMNLAYMLKHAVVVDADVEEPNLELFLKGHVERTLPVFKSYPVIDENKCTLCGACGDFCVYNALLPARKGVLIHKELCHDCGGCAVVCKQGAIHYEDRSIGTLTERKVLDYQSLYTGRLSVGEVSGVKIIETLKEIVAEEPFVLIDSPPGTSCATVAAVEDVDYAILVTEPTPFGLSDMKMVVEMLQNMSIPFGVVINKAGIGDDSVTLFCEINNISILGEIPFSKEYAAVYSRGGLLAEERSEYQDYLREMIKHFPLDIAEDAVGGDR
ncbi:MAG: ATP-binding protein [Clostridia bacterium]|nr:ATP-binding protein [Clostridia bacterium]